MSRVVACTATPSAWSTSAVKRRKTEDSALKEQEDRRALLRRHVRRNVNLADETCVPPSLLGRELGMGVGMGMGMGKSMSMSGGGVGSWSDVVSAAAWADGLVHRGHVRWSPGVDAHPPGVGNLSCLWVGEVGPGTGVVFAPDHEETSPLTCPVPLDQDGNIDVHGTRLPFRYADRVRCPQMSGVEYHSASRGVLLTSRAPRAHVGLSLLKPFGDDVEYHPYQYLSTRSNRRDTVVNGCAAAPSPSNLLCVLATNSGVVSVSLDGSMSSVGSAVAAAAPEQALPKEILDVDFQNPNVVFAGGRSPRIWMADLRSPDNQWASVRHASSVARLRAVGANQIVACGPRNAMALYDVRFVSRRQQRQQQQDRPLVEFPEYRNEAQIHVGFDVWPPGQQSGAGAGGVPPVAAAAHEDGSVALYSLSSGRRLPCRALRDTVNRLREPARPARYGGGRPSAPAGRNRLVGPVKALRFAEMSSDGSPSLWVGQGPSVDKYTFGRGEDDE
ncbi:hypothetical protein GMORB2_6423 [Geosmithia morbida]|uniref:Myocyte-specific enhancer factor 2d n=1 Tax=Geosmithia morbida TaxID=1094350 RepID=A0A9P5D2C7_9HYPO|nr:uncharacterized protein GMORB2_6423 [Geosmithia morbida]KAF4123722.1 hypothetical protein GMORB2_6423 [Geosmithia morbida]